MFLSSSTSLSQGNSGEPSGLDVWPTSSASYNRRIELSIRIRELQEQQRRKGNGKGHILFEKQLNNKRQTTVTKDLRTKPTTPSSLLCCVWCS
ncbi:hypothetical protein WG66_006698 [Moniliophthora roreri]|nr:hypothetical protein WG66_006698 [Moniliophthora roreri]